MTQGKEVHAEYMRQRRGSQKGSRDTGFTDKGSQLKHYPAIVLALTDPIKRDKIERITNSLKAHRVLEGVRYGIGGPTFKTIDSVINRKSPPKGA